MILPRFVLLAMLLMAGATHASSVTFSESATLTSDYRFRGLSRSDGDPAVQGSIEASHVSGFYAGLWASSVSGAQLAGAGAELDGYAGYRGQRGQLGYDIGAQYYTYPGAATGSRLVQAEIYGSASMTLPKVSTNVRVGAALAPQQGRMARANLYGYGELMQPVPTTAITLRAHLGYTRSSGVEGATATQLSAANYLDYTVGADYVWHRVTANLSYIGTDISADRASAYPFVPGGLRASSKGKVMISLTAHF